MVSFSFFRLSSGNLKKSAPVISPVTKKAEAVNYSLPQPNPIFDGYGPLR
jgi:hypothetical protein